jgi:transformation/transcription domain-associated protein
MIIKNVIEKFLDPLEEIIIEYDESLRIDLFHLAILLHKYLPNDFLHHQKELIKFGWNHFKRGGSANNQWAF